MITQFKIFERLKLYSSNFDKYIMPNTPGWYVQYKTHSFDTEFIKVDREPQNIKDAFNILDDILDDFFTVRFYMHISQEEIEQYNLEKETDKYNLW